MMGNRATREGLGSEEERDLEIAGFLSALDPASSDANYWMRFQTWVLTSAAPELARRRLMARLTMGDVLAGWARTVVPAAALAALVAGVILVQQDRQPRVTAAPASVEELLVAGMEDETIPVALTSQEAAPSVAFASERF